MPPIAPVSFRLMCRNFGPNLDEIVSSWDDMIVLALHNLDMAEAKSLAPFIEELLGSGYSDNDLKEFWWAMPVTAVFSDGSEVRQFLMRLREALSRSPYAEAL
jgi:hypothetical protein